jgi:hypothetical protein
LSVSASTASTSTGLGISAAQLTTLASGLGRPDETEALRRHVADLEQTAMNLRLQLQERTEELDAARTTNRKLMAELNRAPARRDSLPR